ncbi:MAG TPA: cupin domain-containing protein [Alphaproteobacteria bacterium]|nr:cupin domain-containing protein [Alphaproteobacteria bacterium]
MPSFHPSRGALVGPAPFGILLPIAATALLIAVPLRQGLHSARDPFTGSLCSVNATATAAQAAPMDAKPRPTTEIIASEPLTHVPGKRVTMVLVKFPPGAYSPEHHHGGSVSVYVLSGAIRSQLEGGPAAVYKAGDTFFEPLGITHLFAENASTTEPAEILAVFVADEGATLTTYH